MTLFTNYYYYYIIIIIIIIIIINYYFYFVLKIYPSSPPCSFRIYKVNVRALILLYYY